MIGYTSNLRVRGWLPQITATAGVVGLVLLFPRPSGAREKGIEPETERHGVRIQIPGRGSGYRLLEDVEQGEKPYPDLKIPRGSLTGGTSERALREPWAEPALASEWNDVPDYEADAAPPSVHRLERDLSRFLRLWKEHGELIGKRKRRQLEIARFHLRRGRIGNDLVDDSQAYEETRDILRSSFLKLVRERVEKSSSFEFFILRNESIRQEGERLIRSWPLRISPRLDLGNDAYLGVNLRPRKSNGAFWPHFAAGFRERLEGNKSSIFLQYEDDHRRLRLEQISAARGNTITLSVRWSL